jgi:hypothetical protein
VSIQHGFTVQRTGDSDIDKLQQRIKAALDAIVAAATASQLSDQGQYVAIGKQDLQNEVRGPDSTAITSVIAAASGYQHLTGTSTLNFMQADTWFDGARVEFFVVNGLTFNHHAAGGTARVLLPFQLLSGAATAKAAGSVIAFRRDDAIGALGMWVQVA